jgi:uncharacterized protein YdeI (YjbR/CyaY-like superfamily)
MADVPFGGVGPGFQSHIGGMEVIETDRFDKVEISSPAQLRDWLAANHAQRESVWLVTYKKHVESRYTATHDILDEILCFDWIDGLRRKLDDDRTKQLISPRRHQVWAKTYKDRATKLIAEGRMQKTGYNAIDASKRDGLWNEMDDVDAVVVPPDLAGALQQLPSAKEWFDASAPSYRRNVLRWIKLAKTPATRAKRIAQTADYSSRGKRIPQI